MNYHGELARADTRRHEAAYPARGRDGYELATRLFLDWTKTEPAALTEEHVREPYIHVMQSREPSGDKSWPFRCPLSPSSASVLLAWPPSTAVRAT